VAKKIHQCRSAFCFKDLFFSAREKKLPF